VGWAGMPAGFKQVRHASQRLVSAVGGADQVQRAILDSTAAAQSGRTSGGFGLASILVGFLDTDLTTKRLNLWQVHVKHSQKHSWEVFTELVLYLPMIVLIAALIANFPDTTSVLKQEEVVKRLILDEEIMDPSEDYAKSAESVEALSDVWAWAERVLLGVLYGAPESVVGAMCAGGASAQPSSPFPPPAPMTPQMIFGHNILVGGIQVRQARQPGEATLCPEEEQDCAECFGCQVGGCTDNPTTRALRQAYAWTAVSGRGRLPLANVSCHTRWRGAVDEEAVSEAELPPFGRTAWCVPGQGCSDAAHARPPGAHNTWCEGRFACAYRQQTFSSSLKGSVLFTEDMAESTGPFRTLDYGNVSEPFPHKDTGRAQIYVGRLWCAGRLRGGATGQPPSGTRRAEGAIRPGRRFRGPRYAYLGIHAQYVQCQRWALHHGADGFPPGHYRADRSVLPPADDPAHAALFLLRERCYGRCAGRVAWVDWAAFCARDVRTAQNWGVAVLSGSLECGGSGDVRALHLSRDAAAGVPSCRRRPARAGAGHRWTGRRRAG
jgi:hypothetical protein